MLVGIYGIDQLIPEPANIDQGGRTMSAPEEPLYFDAEDVPEVLKQETADGSGFENETELPPSDFEETEA